jgi:hypothetical protein
MVRVWGRVEKRGEERRAKGMYMVGVEARCGRSMEEEEEEEWCRCITRSAKDEH